MQQQKQGQEMQSQFQPIIFFQPLFPVQLETNVINNQLNQLAYLQYEVNQQLMVNQMLTTSFLGLIQDRKDKSLNSEASTLQTNQQIVVNEGKMRSSQTCKAYYKKREKKIMSKKDKYNSESQYEPSEQSESFPEYKLSQSKNAPKNFGSSILNYITKNEVKVKNVIEHTGVDFQFFLKFVSKLKNKINTIAELRSLWVQSPQNCYSKVLRILSFEYLRRHSLGHIFNSRIQNHGKHVKYRQKILKQIKKPESFTQMKDF